MLFEELIKTNKEEFLARVQEVADYLEVKADHLMFLMWFETAHTMDHRIQNKIGATGLIQFMPRTAEILGTTTDALREMSNVEQMEFVKLHLAGWRGRYQDFVDLYCAIFWPSAVGKPDDYTITSDLVARLNPIFDINKDGDITKAEIRQALIKQIPLKYKYLFQ